MVHRACCLPSQVPSARLYDAERGDLQVVKALVDSVPDERGVLETIVEQEGAEGAKEGATDAGATNSSIVVAEFDDQVIGVLKVAPLSGKNLSSLRTAYHIDNQVQTKEQTFREVAGFALNPIFKVHTRKVLHLATLELGCTGLIYEPEVVPESGRLEPLLEVVSEMDVVEPRQVELVVRDGRG